MDMYEVSRLISPLSAQSNIQTEPTAMYSDGRFRILGGKNWFLASCREELGYMIRGGARGLLASQQQQ